MLVVTRMKHMTRLEPLTVLDASLGLVIGRRLIPVYSFKMEKW
jgi:hypothetical protein